MEASQTYFFFWMHVHNAFYGDREHMGQQLVK